MQEIDAKLIHERMKVFPINCWSVNFYSNLLQCFSILVSWCCQLFFVRFVSVCSFSTISRRFFVSMIEQFVHNFSLYLLGICPRTSKSGSACHISEAWNYFSSIFIQLCSQMNEKKKFIFMLAGQIVNKTK